MMRAIAQQTGAYVQGCTTHGAGAGKGIRTPDIQLGKLYLDLHAQDGLQAHELAGPVDTLLSKKGR